MADGSDVIGLVETVELLVEAEHGSLGCLMDIACSSTARREWGAGAGACDTAASGLAVAGGEGGG